MNNSIISQRFVSCIEHLLESGKVRSIRQLASQTATGHNSLHMIMKAQREVNIELIQKMVELYALNTDFLFKGNQPMFLSSLTMKDLKILTIVSYDQQRENIVHVPVAAQAGYALAYNDPKYVDAMPKYVLPDFKFKSDGTMRSFDVEGSSMEPNLYAGDKLIASYVHPIDWEKNLKEDKMYVVVSKTDIVVKRISNRIRQENSLLLHSDNKEFISYAVRLHDINEIWEVKAKITTHLNQKQIQDGVLDSTNIDEKLNKQFKLIEKIAQQLQIDKLN